MGNYVKDAVAALKSEVPELDGDLADLYALLALTYGQNTTLVHVHDAWAVWRNKTNPQHPSLVPFGELDHEVQELDRPFMEAIHQAAKTVHR